MRKSLSALVIPPLFLLFLIQASPVFSQQYQGHNWYFGNSPSGVRFSRSDNSATLVNNQRTPFGTGGSSVATDPVNGNLLFYTDGAQIYDATHNLMPNGGALGANTSGNQPVAIAKAPGPGKRYYVFTNTASGTTPGTIAFRIIDMNQLGNALFPSPALGAGETATSTAIGALTGRSEAMITVPHANHEDFWLITHANGSPDYTVALVDATGIASATTITGLGLIDVAANFAYHPATGRISVSPQEARRDIEILNFDNSTGALTFFQRALNTGVQSTIGQAIYDTEWSNSGDFLYISRHGETGIQADVLQYDVNNQLNTVVSVLPQPNTILRSYGLQMAPDSAIYHLYEPTSGVFRLGTITNSDTVGAAVTYTPIAFTANPDFDGLQFPSFAPRDSVLLNITFTAEGTCANSPVSFYPTVTPAADSLRWSFGDGNGATAWSPVHTYTAGGAFQVRVAAYLKGDSAVATQTLNITQFDVQIQLVQDTTACACELPINNGKTTVTGIACPNDTSDDMQVQAQVQGGSPTFQWYGPGGLLPGQTTATLRPDSAGYYYLVATMGACQAYAGVNVKEYDSLDQRANIWHFGQNAGIDFNGLPDDPPVAIRGPLNTPEGTSVISDRNGQVIFSTDGQNIFIRDPADPTQFVDITPPTGLGGQNSSTQSALIMPVPGDETLFYIFTTQAIESGSHELRYSLFDRKLNNGQGDLAESNKLLFARSTERITGNDNWLIAHEYGNNSFRAYPISGQGIGNPVISALGSDHSSAVVEQGQGYMELGARNILAVALTTPGTSNVVELFDFVDSTGMVTNFRTANLNSTAGQVYGIEISPGGNKLYATLRNPGTSQIVEFSIDSVGNPHFKQRVNQTGELGAMQVGPDGQIYVAINGSSSLGTFQANEDTTAVTPLPNPLQPFALLGGTTSQLGLPNFTQIISNPTSTPGFTVAGVCSGDSTTFTGTGKDAAIDKFYWTFGDGQSNIDGGPEIAHLYPALAPGEASRTYTVTLIIYNKCEPLPNGYARFSQNITIFAPPADPTSAFNICQDPLVLDANPPNAAGLTYQWSTGETTETITVNRQAIYNVTITDANTCTTDAQFLVADNRPQVELGASVTICEGTAIAPLDAQNPGATYAWQLNDVANGNTAQTQSVTSTAAGVFEYKVQVTDPVSTCFALDSITYTINESPNWSAGSIVNPTSCNVNDGSFVLTIFGPANTLFTYSVTGPGTGLSGTDQNPGAIIPVTALDAGTYGVTVSDQISGCATINTVSLNDLAFTVAAPDASGCDPITLTVPTTPAQGSLTYRIIDTNTLAVIETGSALSSPFTTAAAGLPSNNQTYTVEVTSAGCTASDNSVVNQDPTVPVTLSPSVCTNPISITASSEPGRTFAWSGSTGVNIDPTTSNQATVRATPTPGTYQYLLTVTQPGAYCPLDTAITVTVDNIVSPDFVLPDACSDQAVLTAEPAGNYTYRWFRNSTALVGGGGRQISVTTADDGVRYRFEVVNTISGCIFPSPEKEVNLEGDLQITLASTPPCQEAPFTITTTANLSPVTIQWFRNGVQIPNQSGTSIVQTENGLYSVRVATTGDQCVRTQDFNIILSPNPPGLLPEKGIICPDPANLDPTTQQVVLDAGPDNLSYEWFKDGVSTGVTTQTYTATDVGFYEVAMTNSFMCSNTDGITLVEECDPRITGPNAFRPGSEVNEGGEYVNREFKLFTFFIADTDFQIFIFNRWGEMVFQSASRDFKWNGGYNNNPAQPLPPGTYSYKVQFKSTYRPGEGIHEKRGGVVLLR